MCNYRGPADPSRVLPNELREKEVHHQLTLLTGHEADKISLEVVVEAIHREALPREVTFSAWLCLGRKDLHVTY